MPCIESFDVAWPNSGFTNRTSFQIDNEEHLKLIRHLFRRMGFGASVAEIEWAQGKSINYIVNQLIGGKPNNFDSGAADIGLPQENGSDIFNWSNGEASNPRRPKYDATAQDYQMNNLSVNAIAPSYLNEIIAYYWLNEALNGDATKINNYKPFPSTAGAVRAKLLLFWHSHFSTQEDIETDMDKVCRYFRVLDKNAFGNFKDFVEDIGRTPMMLMYLSGHFNNGDPYFGGGYKQSSEPNENYARELLELFTMGPVDKDGAPNYSDNDIIQIARMLTGWRAERYGNKQGNDVPDEHQLRFQFTAHDWNTVYGDKPISLGTNNTYFVNGYDCWKAVFDENVKFTEYATYWKLNGAPSPVPVVYDSNIPAPPIDSTAHSNANDPSWKNIYTNGVVVDDKPTSSELAIYEDYLFGNGNTIPEAYYDPIENNLSKSIIMAGTLQYRWLHHILFTEKADEIAYFICKKLYKFYIYGDVEAVEDSNGVKGYIEELATVFKQQWEITDVLKALFKSRHFYDPGVIGTQIKSPIASVSSFFRSAGLTSGESPVLNANNQWVPAPGVDYTHRLQMVRSHIANDTSKHAPPTYLYTIGGTDYHKPHPNYIGGVIDRMTAQGMATEPNMNAPRSPLVTEFYNHRNQDTALIFRKCSRMGQKLLNPPDVSGWPGYHNWLNEFTLISRWNLMTEIFDKFNDDSITIGSATKEKFKALAKHLLAIKYGGSAPAYYANCEEWVRELWDHFFCVDPTTLQIEQACFIFTNNWPYQNYGAPSLALQDLGTPETQGIDTAVTERVMAIVHYFTRQPDYQLT